MTARATVTLATTVFVLALAQFFSALGGIWAALPVALLLPFATIGLLRFFDAEVGNLWFVIGPVLASALGVTIWTVSRSNSSAAFWACPLLAFGLAAAVLWWRNRDSRRCSLCNRGLSGEVSFTCPRCGLVVCETKCWDFARLRCRLCVQNQVPVFSPDGRWWDHTFGPATPHGRCQLCQATGEETELRNCPKCGRPQCRQCWDDANGVCSRCQWVVGELPESLKMFMG